MPVRRADAKILPAAIHACLADLVFSEPLSSRPSRARAFRTTAWGSFSRSDVQLPPFSSTSRPQLTARRGSPCERRRPRPVLLRRTWFSRSSRRGRALSTCTAWGRVCYQARFSGAYCGEDTWTLFRAGVRRAAGLAQWDSLMRLRCGPSPRVSGRGDQFSAGSPLRASGCDDEGARAG